MTLRFVRYRRGAKVSDFTAEMSVVPRRGELICTYGFPLDGAVARVKDVEYQLRDDRAQEHIVVTLA